MIRKKYRFIVFVSALFLFASGFSDQLYSTMPKMPEIMVSVVGEPKINQLFELKISVKNASYKGKAFFQLFFDFKTEVPPHIKILSGSTKWQMTAKETYSIKMQITEVSVNPMLISAQGNMMKEFRVYTAPTRGGLFEWSDAPEVKSLIKEISKEQRKSVVEISRIPFFVTPSGKVKVWTKKDQHGKPWRFKEYKEIDSPDKNRYLPLNFLQYYKGDSFDSSLSDKFYRFHKLFLENKFSEGLSLLKELSKSQLSPEVQAIYYNDLGILHLVLGNKKKGIEHIKKAAGILESKYEQIKEKDEKLFKKIRLYKRSTTSGYLYPWDEDHFPHEQLYESVYQNLSVVYILEGKYEEGIKVLAKSKIKRMLKGKYQKNYESEYKKTIDYFKRVKGVKYKMGL